MDRVEKGTYSRGSVLIRQSQERNKKEKLTATTSKTFGHLLCLLVLLADLLGRDASLHEDFVGENFKRRSLDGLWRASPVGPACKTE